MKLVSSTHAMHDDLPLTTSYQADEFSATLVVAGEVDLATAPVLRTALTEAIGNDPAILILDLGRLEFLSASGAMSIISAVRARTHARTVIVTDSPSVRRPLTLLGVGTTLETFSSTGIARAALMATAAVDGRVAG